MNTATLITFFRYAVTWIPLAEATVLFFQSEAHRSNHVKKGQYGKKYLFHSKREIKGFPGYWFTFIFPGLRLHKETKYKAIE
jgi:hypothetical protein